MCCNIFFFEVVGNEKNSSYVVKMLECCLGGCKSGLLFQRNAIGQCCWQVIGQICYEGRVSKHGDGNGKLGYL